MPNLLWIRAQALTKRNSFAEQQLSNKPNQKDKTMLNKEEIRLAAVIAICSTILLSACIYIYVSSPQKTSFFQLSLTSPDGAILPPEINVTSGQSNTLSIAVQNSMGSTQLCRLDTELLILNSTGNSLNSTALTSYTFYINSNGIWSKNFTYEVNSNLNNNQTLQIIFDNAQVQVSQVQYNQTLLFQFRFNLSAYDTSASAYVSTNTWVSSPFLNVTE
jgi:hypothetical protein